MLVRRVVALLVMALFMGTIILPGVLAQDLTAGMNRTITLNIDPSFPANQEVNMAKIGAANTTAPDLEKDFLHPQFMEVGRYVGPYIHSSKFRFTYDTGGDFNFSVSYKFTPEELMSGSSTYWIRWPIDTIDYDGFCVSIFGQFSNYLGNPYPYKRCTGTLLVSPLVPGVRNLTLGSWTIADSTGLYIKEWNGLLSNVTYTFAFNGHLAQGASPSVWISIERLQQQLNTTYTFSDFTKGSHHTERLPLYPAFAFNFVQGFGEGGLTSYNLPFDGTNGTYLALESQALDVLGPSVCNKYLSFYVPFFGADNVSWSVAVVWQNTTLVSAGPPVVFGPDIHSVILNRTTTTRNFLLVSSPKTIDNMTFGQCTSSGASEAYIIYISANKPVTILGFMDKPETPFSSQLWQLALEDGVPWQAGPFPVGGSAIFHHRWIPAFIDVEITSGRWATVTPGSLYQTYDFGWGRAYLFPGAVNLTMFLNNGTAIGFDSILTPVQAGKCQGLIQNATVAFQAIADWINKLACFITSIAGDIVGVIRTVFQAVWNAIKAIGEWIYNALVNFIELIVSIATDLVNIVSQIVFSLLYSTPFILVLFVSAKAMPEVGDAIEKKVRTAYRRSTFAQLRRKGQAKARRRSK